MGKKKLHNSRRRSRKALLSCILAYKYVLSTALKTGSWSGTVPAVPKLHRKSLEILAQKNDGDREAAPSESYRPGSLRAATIAKGRVPYGEESRKYRRTVYGHSDWVAHRSGSRIFSNLKGLFFSGIVRQLRQEVGIVTLIGVLVVVWNGHLPPTWDLATLRLPVQPFTLSSPALGLLLVFRTNASYGRWTEARGRWSTFVSQSRNLVRMAATFADPPDAAGRLALRDLATMSWAFSRSVMNMLAGPEDASAFDRETLAAAGEDPDAPPSSPSSLLRRLREERPEDRPSLALVQLSLTLDAVPLDEKRRVEADKSLVIMGDALGACERVFSTPVPLVYTRHAARFLALWMLLLPLALYGPFEAEGFAYMLVPASSLLALFLFGIEELAVQLEEPFSILPMERFCQEIRGSTQKIVEQCLAFKGSEPREHRK